MNTCIKCGCDDAYPSLPPCPTPEGCPNPQPCAEFFDANCIRFTLPNIVCGLDTVVFQDDTLSEALDNIVSYFCQRLVTLTDYINSQLDIINGRLETIEGDIVDIKSDITTIQGDISDIQGNITDIQGDISSLTSSVNNLTNITETKQKFISTDYTISDADDNYSIIITNGSTPVNITVPTGLMAKLQVGFIQDGTADVTFIPTGGVVLNNAITGYKIKGQYYQSYLEQGATSSIYYLLGNTKV